VKHFDAPEKWLADIDARSASSMIQGSADIALVIDRDGTVRDLAVSSDGLSDSDFAGLIDHPWTESVTSDSRSKVEALLTEASPDKTSRSRHVNHPTGSGSDVPVQYSAIRMPKTGHVIALGRDLSAVAALQQRLVNAQQSIERDYARLRNLETRYRVLFTSTSEAFVVLDASSQRILEANPAAESLLQGIEQRVVGEPLQGFFDTAGAREINELLTGVRSRSSLTVRMRPVNGSKPGQVRLSSTPFRQDRQLLLLVRMSAVQDDTESTPASRMAEKVLAVMENTPDGFVLTGADGGIIFANRSFLNMAEVMADSQVIGESLDRWLGRSGVDMSVLMSSLKDDGSIRLFSTSLRGEYGSTSQIEISCVTIEHSEQLCYGFIIRTTGQRMSQDAQENVLLPRSTAQLSELVGRVPLKELVRETTEVVEKLFIQSALEVTSDNRAYAAEMLGLSRQSLYAKLHRYGLANRDAPSA